MAAVRVAVGIVVEDVLLVRERMAAAEILVASREGTVVELVAHDVHAVLAEVAVEEVPSRNNSSSLIATSFGQRGDLVSFCGVHIGNVQLDGEPDEEAKRQRSADAQRHRRCRGAAVEDDAQQARNRQDDCRDNADPQPAGMKSRIIAQ
ncbi:MAG TPA: hypothetical protein VK694_06060 [Verrucomicrobiae bacterium]|nr:hypothetical protein [Verrucomicrobiae bacterium]